MATNCVWDDEARTLYRVEMLDEWTWDDFTAVIKEAYEMLGKLTQKVDFIMAFYSPLPEGSALQPLAYAGVQPPNIRHTVMLNQTGLGTTLFMSSLIEAVDRVHEWHGPKFVSTLEEARSYLKSLEEQ